MRPIRLRLEIWKSVLWTPFSKPIGILSAGWAAVSTIAAIAGAMFPAVESVLDGLPKYIRWPWYIWAIVILSLLVMFLLEGSYRVLRPQEGPTGEQAAERVRLYRQASECSYRFRRYENVPEFDGEPLDQLSAEIQELIDVIQGCSYPEAIRYRVIARRIRAALDDKRFDGEWIVKLRELFNSLWELQLEDSKWDLARSSPPPKSSK